ncbi:phosphoribosyl-ATP pyrophosphatase /phosphoribosyl-AMP cyclohydrolase [Chitinophaga ginsengisegetis]|uniref:Histidine biosynthesis bifunctional protein HisIE n=1 Tax=Chitinophaga ginsengisegetis TaxID=393003 RepID=A0A1T5P087_9BACT|nr:bifunctional phosphoribosyl-AMP cyclohydrolase/phosphoribosyl-ATP diphosphatase HisIE [Chitinophaga ginsengisegetis]MDR6566975.1 phosphoribosyl-ATP pyrophosphohydrolase/phosphoribosyl-AMP cyclohydrolase [Chitinophaga ginsengisegetis]MDR6646705.1 phosphoribosyl-ATP pyrophosphohydrolase/phosphoribosyl-AMP cyclohydrolase [Chitinophaga ginsengisegetis]MDR6653055.1 phosphoribosyl-ATP pyrophosphohydrolase/phosphoribosyl-AMP cyclohydrolase [Chitinophaga ginsengisegetis]SKD06046.1 phosphoribosyl-ATP
MQIDFQKSPDGLVPAIIQDAITNKVLMLGYMNRESLEKTVLDGKVTFFSRSKNRLWTKGEESGNFLMVKDLMVDCDQDTILIKASPVGPVCHTGADTCWDEKNVDNNFLSTLENIITDRKNNPSDKSYTASLFAKGINKIAQKVGEEAVEVVIEAKDNNDELFLNESADLLFHYLILLQAKGFQLSDVISVLKQRHK